MSRAEFPAIVLQAYHKAIRLSLTHREIHAVVDSHTSGALQEISRQLTDTPGLIENFSEEEIDACFEMTVIELLSRPKSQQDELLNKIENDLSAILSVDTPKARAAGGKLVGCLLLALEELDAEYVEKIMALLASFTGREEGIKRPELIKDRHALSPDATLSLSKLLDYALFGEVFAFLTGFSSLKHAADRIGIEDLPAALIPVASRKGGVGKSTLVLAIALTLLRREAHSRVCIVDLDITGPIWQYVLCPNGRGVDGTPLRYLNELVNIDQPDSTFRFGMPKAEDLKRCVNRVRIPSVEADAGLLTFSDLPRTNRYLVQVIANNRTSFTDFLVAVLSALASEFDYILLDNTPGLDPHPLLTLVLAGNAKHGCPILVSSPHVPDIRGTFLELSDLSLLDFTTPPLWIINKANKEVRDFFGEKRTLIEIAEKTRGYEAIMPAAPLLKKLLTKQSPAQIIRPLPFDANLAQPNNVDFAHPLTGDGIATFINSELFREFATSIEINIPRIDRQTEK